MNIVDLGDEALKNNPWGLTPNQCRAILAINETGSIKGASVLLGKTQKTVEYYVVVLRKKIGKHRWRCQIEFDRWWQKELAARQPMLADGGES